MFNAEILALFIAGLVASPVAQFIKERLKMEGRKALWLTFGVCVVIAGIAQVVTGELRIPMALQDPFVFLTDLGLAFSAVFGLATIVFHAKFRAKPAPAE